MLEFFRNFLPKLEAMCGSRWRPGHLAWPTASWRPSADCGLLFLTITRVRLRAALAILKKEKTDQAADNPRVDYASQASNTALPTQRSQHGAAS